MIGEELVKRSTFLEDLPTRDVSCSEVEETAAGRVYSGKRSDELSAK